MTDGVSHHQAYVNRWAPYRESWDKLLHDDVFERNSHLPDDLPAASVTGCLDSALQCIYPGDRQHGDVFLARAIKHADRQIAEKRYLDTEIAELLHPYELAVIMRGRAFAHWLLGERLDRTTLRQVAEYIVTYCRTKTDDRTSFTDSMTMNHYLQGVRAAIIASDLDYAGELLKAPDRFRWHHAREFDLWRRLVCIYPEVTDEFEKEFEIFFDIVRDPEFTDADEIGPVAVDRITLALETGVIREMYIINASPHEPVDPNVVIKAVAR